MNSPQTMVIAAGVIALLVLAVSLIFLFIERRNRIRIECGDDLSFNMMKAVHMQDILIAGGVLAVLAVPIAVFLQISSAAAFIGGAALILLVSEAVGRLGLEGSSYLCVDDETGRELWTEPSIESQAVGVSLASLSFLAVWTVCYLWPKPLVLVWLIAGCCAAALIARLGGSLMTLGCNTGREQINQIIAQLQKKRSAPKMPNRLLAVDHGGMAAEYMVLYTVALVLGMGFGIIDPSNEYATKSILVQLAGVAVLVFSLAEIVFIKLYKDKKRLAFMLNRLVGGCMLAALITVTVFGSVLLKPAPVDLLWPVISGFAVLLMTMGIMQYNTSRRYKKIQNISRLSRGGPAMLALGGGSLGIGGMLWPVLLLCILTLLAFGAGGGKSQGTACLMMMVGFISSLAPLFMAYYFADESRDICMYERNDQAASKSDSDHRRKRKGSMSAAMLQGLAIVCVGLMVLGSLSYIVHSNRDGSLYAVSIYMIMAFFLGTAIAMVVPAIVAAVARRAITDIMEEFSRPLREVCRGRQPWSADIVILHKSLLRKYMVISPWYVITPVVAMLLATYYLLGAENLPALMLSFGICSFCMLLWFETTGGAWMSAFKFVEAGNYAERGSESYNNARQYALLGLVFRRLLVPAMRLTVLLALGGCILLLMSTI